MLTATLLTLKVALFKKLAPQTSNDPHKGWNSHAFLLSVHACMFLLALMVLWCMDDLFFPLLCMCFFISFLRKNLLFHDACHSHSGCLHNACLALGVTQEHGVDFSSQKGSLTGFCSQKSQ